MNGHPVEGWISPAVSERVAEFAAQLRSGVRGAQPVPNLTWTVTDLAQHVASLPDFWRMQHDAGAGFERPVDFAAYSDGVRAHITETDPAALADLIQSGFAEFLASLESDARPRWLYGRQATPAHLCGMALNELVLHGRDLAAVTGAPKPTFERREANLAIYGIMVTTPAFIDHDRAMAQPNGVYHLHFRGGNDYTWIKQGGTLSISLGRPDKPDARLNADPAVFLMASLGRYSQVRAALTFKVVASGKKPWRFLGLGKMTADGV